MSTPSFNLPSFAKINWSLRVLGRRADGYHEVSTILQTISLRDELQFVPRGDARVELSCDDPQIPTDESNLIIRAASALRDRFHISAGVTIHLEKRIPAQAGLGGASSNAAVAFLGLTKLWNLDIDVAEMIDLGGRIGADVPFFFFGGRALGTGIGTDLKVLPDYPKKHLLIVKPNAMVSTADAYKAMCAPALTSPIDASILTSSCSAAGFADNEQGELHNDFERVIFEIEPEIERARTSLLKSSAKGALLAGSGSSVFGIFDNAEAQARAFREFQAEAGWRMFPCVTVSRHEYLQTFDSCGVSLLRSQSEI